ncbi:VOC family protein [Halocatena halophila]|uniref:VOC family protein n=1 Tax=Halocatena halophila TaxID=2814576 RepID=UPI002ED016A0
MEVLHNAVWVSDLETTLSFYVDALGLEKRWEFVGDDGTTNVFVGGTGEAEIQFKHRPDRVPPESDGYDHVAVGVADVDAEFERLVDETGCAVRLEPSHSDGADTRVAFVEDPDGYGVELVEVMD